MVASRMRFAVLWTALSVLAGCGAPTSQAPEQTAQAPKQTTPTPEHAAETPEHAAETPEHAAETPEQAAETPEQAQESKEASKTNTASTDDKPAAPKGEVKDSTAQTDEATSAEDDEAEPDVIFVPTPQAVVDKMLELADIKAGDVVYDLGCGDGRIVITAAKKYGVKAYGFDIDPERIQESLENVKKNKVEHLVTIKKADIFKLDLSEANVVTLYLLPSLNVKLMPQLEKLKPGSRIMSHDFDMRGAKPEKVVTMNATSDSGFESEHTIYLWTVPWEKEEEE